MLHFIPITVSVPITFSVSSTASTPTLGSSAPSTTSSSAPGSSAPSTVRSISASAISASTISSEYGQISIQAGRESETFPFESSKSSAPQLPASKMFVDFVARFDKQRSTSSHRIVTLPARFQCRFSSADSSASTTFYFST